MVTARNRRFERIAIGVLTRAVVVALVPGLSAGPVALAHHRQSGWTLLRLVVEVGLLASHPRQVHRITRPTSDGHTRG